MKTCKTCSKSLSDDKFYKGHARCKPCYIAVVKSYREANAEKISNYEKKRYLENPDRKSAMVRYSKTNAGKKAKARAIARYISNNPEKRAAHNAVNNAVRDKRLFKEPCEMCGELKVHAHHDDYSKPLEVRWLCVHHHALIHAEEKRK